MPTNASPVVSVMLRGAREQKRALLRCVCNRACVNVFWRASGLAAASAPADPVAGRRAGGRAAAPLVARTIGLHEYTRTHTHARTFLRAALCVLPSQALACMSPHRHAITFKWTARRRPGALTLSQSSASVVPLQIISCRLPALHASSDQAVMPRTKEGSLTWYARNESQIVISWLSSSL